MPAFEPLVSVMRSRVHDDYGSGQYGVSRDGGSGRHMGLDVVVPPDAYVNCPLDGNVIG